MSTHQLNFPKHHHHTHQADRIPGVSISYQTALSTILQFPAHPASALALHPNEMQALWWQNHDTGSYETVYQVDNSNNDDVKYWTMTGIHVLPDKQQYIGLQQAHALYRIDSSMKGTHQLHLANVDLIPGLSIKPLFQRIFDEFQHSQRPCWLFILERYKFCNKKNTTQAAMIRCTR